MRPLDCCYNRIEMVVHLKSLPTSLALKGNATAEHNFFPAARDRWGLVTVSCLLRLPVRLHKIHPGCDCKCDFCMFIAMVVGVIMLCCLKQIQRIVRFNDSYTLVVKGGLLARRWGTWCGSSSSSSSSCSSSSGCSRGKNCSRRGRRAEPSLVMTIFLVEVENDIKNLAADYVRAAHNVVL